MPEVTPTVNPLVVLLILGLMASVVGSWIWIILRFALRSSVLPRFEPRIVPWGVLSVLATIVLWLVVQVVGQVTFGYLTHGTVKRHADGSSLFSPSEMMVASGIQNTAVLVVIPLFLMALNHARPRDFGLTGRNTGTQILQGIVAWPLAAPLVYGMMAVAVKIWGKEDHPLETAIQNEGVGGLAVIFFLAGAILAPAAEELIFRGVLLGWLTRIALGQHANQVNRPISPTDVVPAELTTDLLALDPRHEAADEVDPNPFAPPLAVIESEPAASADQRVDRPFVATQTQTVRLVLANVLVSVLFAALHYSVWPTPVPIFFLSLVLGLLYQRTGSLIAPVALHMTFNGVSTILMLLTVGMGLKPDMGSPPKAPLPIPAPLPKPVPPTVGLFAQIQVDLTITKKLAIR